MAWKQVEPEEPQNVKYIGVCDYCGMESGRVHRAHSSAGGPPYYDKSNHDDARECIYSLRMAGSFDGVKK